MECAISKSFRIREQAFVPYASQRRDSLGTAHNQPDDVGPRESSSRIHSYLAPRLNLLPHEVYGNYRLLKRSLGTEQSCRRSQRGCGDHQTHDQPRCDGSSDPDEEDRAGKTCGSRYLKPDEAAVARISEAWMIPTGLNAKPIR